jgi:Flp pilus assembly protein TadG
MSRLARVLRDDRGSIMPLVPIVLLAIMLLGALVVDGSNWLNERSEAQSYAEEAARAGATAVDLAAPDLTLVTDGGAKSAQQRVDDYCAALRNVNSTITSCKLASPAFTDATDDKPGCPKTLPGIVVNTVVTMRVSTVLLGMVGLTDMTATGSAQARPFEGTSAATAC